MSENNQEKESNKIPPIPPIPPIPKRSEKDKKEGNVLQGLINLVAVLLVALIAYFVWTTYVEKNETKTNETSQTKQSDNKSKVESDSDSSDSDSNDSSSKQASQADILNYKNYVKECNLNYAQSGVESNACKEAEKLKNDFPGIQKHKQEAIDEVNKKLELDTKKIDDEVKRTKAEFLQSTSIGPQKITLSEEKKQMYNSMGDNIMSYVNKIYPCNYGKNGDSYCDEAKALKQKSYSKYINYDEVKKLVLLFYESDKKMKFDGKTLDQICKSDAKKCQMPGRGGYGFIEAGAK